MRFLSAHSRLQFFNISLSGIALLKGGGWSGATVRIYWSVSTTNLYIHLLAPNPSSQLPSLFPVSLTRWTPIPSRPTSRKERVHGERGGFSASINHLLLPQHHSVFLPIGAQIPPLPARAPPSLIRLSLRLLLLPHLLSWTKKTTVTDPVKSQIHP